MMKSGQKRPRFGLLELLLLTGVIAAWLPTYMATKKIPGLESSIEQMLARTEDLQIVDDTKLCVRSVPTVWTNMQAWKYYAPKNAKLELRFATEGIQSIEYPIDYQSVSLPAGEHRLFLKYTSDDKGYLTELYIDDDLMLTELKPKEWINSNGYSSQGDASNTSAAYAIDEPLTLRRMRYSYSHPIEKYGSYGYPDGYDCKGSYLWIASHSLKPVAPPVFVSPSVTTSRPRWGHRQGAGIVNYQNSSDRGFLKILPSYFAVLGQNEYNWSSRPTLISVRPIVEGSTTAEAAEQQISQDYSFGKGLSYTILDTLDATAKTAADNNQLSIKSTGVFSNDGKTMRLFVHYEAFSSGAQPIVELIFDAGRPNTIGFIIHEAPGSTPMKACQLVSMKDADYQWQEIALTSAKQDDDETVKRSLAEFYPGAPATQTELEWITIPIDQIPMTSRPSKHTMRQLQFHTTIKDFSKVLYPLGVPLQRKYKGVPNSQSWSIPASQEKAPITVEIRGTRVYPGTKLAIANGMVLQNVRVTVPLEQREPVWLSYTAD